MSMIELGTVILCLVCATVAGLSGYRAWGVIGAIASTAVGFLFPAGVIVLLKWFGAALQSRRPPRPVCQNGTCQWDDYEAVDCCGDNIVFVCKCGLKYISIGNRFLRLLDSDLRSPYMVRDEHGKWREDRADEDASPRRVSTLD